MTRFCVGSLGGEAEQIAQGVDIGGAGIADDNVAEASMGPGLDAETLIAACGDGSSERHDSLLVLHDKDG